MLQAASGRGSAASASLRLLYTGWDRILPALSTDLSQPAKGFARKATGDIGGQDDLPRSKQSKGWREWADKVLDKGEQTSEPERAAPLTQQPDAEASLDAARQQAASLADPAGVETAQMGALSLPDAPDIEAGASVLEDGSRPEAASASAAAADASMLQEPAVQQPSSHMPEPQEAAQPAPGADLPEAAQAAVQDLADAALMQKSSPEAALRALMDAQPKQAASKHILPKKLGAPAMQPPAEQPQQPALVAGPGRRAVFPEPSERPNDMLGFARLGDQAPEDLRPATSFGFTGRIHPTRTFYPGQTYTPQDLIQAPADAAAAASPPPRNWASKPQLKRMPAHLVLEHATFTNYQMLDNFVTDAGRLHPRRRTALQAKTHRYLNRQIKIARTMALLPPTRRLADRWDELDQSQYEEQQYQ